MAVDVADVCGRVLVLDLDLRFDLGLDLPVFSALLLLFCISFFVLNFGPGTTTYVLPQRCFPVEVRSTANGISAATGKIGSFVATAGFKPLLENAGLEGVFFVCCGVSILGLLITVFAVPKAPLHANGAMVLRPSLLHPSMPELFASSASVMADFPDHRRSSHLQRLALAQAQAMPNSRPAADL